MDKYTATHQMRLLQERAEVDPALAESVVAYTRLCTDRGVEPVFFTEEEAAQAIADSPFYQQAFIERNSHLDAQVKGFFIAYGQELARRRVPILFSAEDLAFRLGISMRQLNWLSYAKQGRYRMLERSKANGKIRILHAPNSKLKTVQRWITSKIILKQKPHPYATAYYPGSTLAQGADPHVGRKVVIRMDLKDFFPSITYAQVRRVFSSFGYSYGVASALASLCCLEGKLVQGAPSSPALSNLVALNIDRRITGLKKHLKSADQKFYYTRYADDLIFSFDEENMVGTLPLIRQIVREEGFVVNEDKLRIMRSGRQQQVTGVVVNQRLNVNAAECRRLRAVLHNIRNHGWDTEMQRWQSNMGTCVRNQVHFRQILEGRIAFVRSLNPEKGGMLLDGLKAIELT
jgi:RNA-directed DNA polymerase